VRRDNDGLGELIAEIGNAGLVNLGVVLGKRERDARFIEVFLRDQILVRAARAGGRSRGAPVSTRNFAALDVAGGLLQLREDSC